jgi:FkbM family methyltransferase
VNVPRPFRAIGGPLLRSAPVRSLRRLAYRLARADRVNGLPITVPPELFSRYVVHRSEQGVLDLIRDLLRPGSVAVDVGAAIGWLTVGMAERVGAQGRVHALEPAPNNLGVLLENVRRNRLSQVEVSGVAAGKSVGLATLRLAPSRLMSSLHFGQSDTDVSLRVAVHPLDDLVPDPVDLVKIDAEGGDLDVLEGMDRIISSNPGLRLVVEWFPDGLRSAGREPEELPRFLAERGFETFLLEREPRSRRLVVRRLTDALRADMASRRGLWHVNLLAARGEAAEGLERR